ncbi:hypothetical protein BDQ17DRAFT_1541414 [Cyathus striatus]|nr:hypothetical protein BDQ17DRAFT_1541414 [Cyathus striatus]
MLSQCQFDGLVIGLKRTPETLNEFEDFWRDHQAWLKEQGYILNMRYSPNWIPSWTTFTTWITNGQWIKFGDCDVPIKRNFINAIRESDGEKVTLKRIHTPCFPAESSIAQFFSSEPLVSNPDNQCIPVYDVLRLPDDEDFEILVTPYYSWFRDPVCFSYGRLLNCFRGIIKGLQFMHHHDVSIDQVSYRGTEETRFYITDFSQCQYHLGHPPYNIWDYVYDISFLGRMLRSLFGNIFYYAPTCGAIGLVEKLTADMINEESFQHINMDEVMERFSYLTKSLCSWKLRARVRSYTESLHEGPCERLLNNVKHRWNIRLGPHFMEGS